jgi:hypothetical protein
MRFTHLVAYSREMDPNGKEFKKRVGLQTRTPACCDHSAWNSWRYARPYYCESFLVDYLMWCNETSEKREFSLPIRNPKNIQLIRKPKKIFDERRLKPRGHYRYEEYTGD